MTVLQPEQMHLYAWASPVDGLKSRKALCKKKLTIANTCKCSPKCLTPQDNTTKIVVLLSPFTGEERRQRLRDLFKYKASK